MGFVTQFRHFKSWGRCSTTIHRRLTTKKAIIHEPTHFCMLWTTVPRFMRLQFKLGGCSEHVSCACAARAMTLSLPPTDPVAPGGKKHNHLGTASLKVMPAQPESLRCASRITQAICDLRCVATNCSGLRR